MAAVEVVVKGGVVVTGAEIKLGRQGETKVQFTKRRL